MWLFVLASLAMGWALPTKLVITLLAKRKLCPSPAAASQLTCSAMTKGQALLVKCNALIYSLTRILNACLMGAFSLIAWQLLPAASCVIATIGFACLLVIAECDLERQIIPWEPCAILLALGCLEQLLMDGLVALAISAVGALAIAALLFAANAVSHAFSKKDAIGHGDLRAIPAVCVFVGPVGAAAGGLACSIVLCAQAITACIRARGQPPKHLPMGAAIVIWFVVGVFAQGLL